MKQIQKLAQMLLLAIFLMGCAGIGANQEPGLPASGGVTPQVVVRPTSTAAVVPETEVVLPSPEATGETVAPTQTAEPLPTATLAPQFAASLPDPAGYEWRVVVDGLSSPVGAAAPLDGSGQIYILEKVGRIRVVLGGQILDGYFLDITDRVGSGGSEQGLLGLAFHPQYGQNGYFFVNYTDKSGNTVISRFEASAGQADPASEKQLITQEQPYGNHNGGGLAFGPDGYLYAGLGDGGSAGDPHRNGQSLDTLLGKLLRIDVDNAEPYGIPADNPFANGGGRVEIWAYGLRNPWRFAFDPLTGDLYIADVGQNKFEEVNFVEAGNGAGFNFGWHYREGMHEFEGGAPGGLVDPVVEYDHSFGCSITGGAVYRGQMPEWQGVYFYADWCSGTVWGLLRLPDGTFQNEVIFEGLGNVTAFGQDEAGEVYIVDYNGRLLQLVEKGS